MRAGCGVGGRVAHLLLELPGLPLGAPEEELEAALGEGAVRHLRLRRAPAAQPHPVADGGGALEVGHVVHHAQLLLLRQAAEP